MYRKFVAVKISIPVLVLSGLALFFSSCHKDEPLYENPTVAEGLQTQVFEMGESYSQQLFFDFESQQVGSNAFGTWDLAVACNGTPHVIICGGKNVQFSAARMQNVEFLDVHSINRNSLDWRFDNPNGNIDSTAMCSAFESTPDGYYGIPNDVYIMDLGADSALDRRYVKIQFLNAIGGIYQFLWGYVYDSSQYYITKIQTKPEYNYAYFSFAQRKLVQNEVFQSRNWDVVFTTYKEGIPDQNGLIYDYVIRGALINPNKISVVQIDNTADFNTLNYIDALQLPFNKNWNEIGYDWKEYDQTAGRYTIVPNRFYVLKTTNGNYFKMRFVDFYDDQGRKGYPKMAWELLKP